MFLNYLAGVVSLILAISSFIPWVTVWFYSLKGIESIYGIVILVLGLMGVTVAIFQHLSGKMRGRAFISISILSFICSGLYFRKMADYGARLNEIVGLLKDIFGETLMQKIQQMLGEQWAKILGKVIQRMGIQTSVSGFDFVGGGLILAILSAAILIVIGILMEKKKTLEEQ